MSQQQISINRPDDMHLHLRDDTILKSVISYTSKDFGRAIVMPNLLPPITTAHMASLYRDRILKSVKTDHNLSLIHI